MPASKRASDSSPTRASKAAKTSSSSTAKGKKGKSAKATLPTSAFKAKALPLHVNVTHTPPGVPADDTETVVPDDPGYIGNLTLVPSSFATGSYGWKGTKRVTVELQDSEGSEKEKVQVMLTINATVVGSKNAAEEDDSEQKEEKEGEKEGVESPTED